MECSDFDDDDDDDAAQNGVSISIDDDIAFAIFSVTVTLELVSSAVAAQLVALDTANATAQCANKTVARHSQKSFSSNDWYCAGVLISKLVLSTVFDPSTLLAVAAVNFFFFLVLGLPILADKKYC
jgi:hypothetical protein